MKLDDIEKKLILGAAGIMAVTFAQHLKKAPSGLFEIVFARPYIQVVIVILSLLGYIYFTQQDHVVDRLNRNDTSLVQIVQIQQEHSQIIGKLQDNQKDITEVIKELKAVSVTEKDAVILRDTVQEKLDSLDKRLTEEIASRKQSEQETKTWMRDIEGRITK